MILRYGEAEKELCGFEPASTSQRMELIAAIKGLEALNGRKRVRLYSDSQYLVRGMSEWLPGWVRSGRLETPDALANQDLWQQLAILAANHQVHWEWVRGHAGHPFNERCDRLAKRAVEAGIQGAAAGARSEVVPLPTAPVYHAPLSIQVDSEFEIDANGQLQLC